MSISGKLPSLFPLALQDNDFYYYYCWSRCLGGSIENFPHLESLRHVRGPAITAGSLHFGQILAHNSILHAGLYRG